MADAQAFLLWIANSSECLDNPLLGITDMQIRQGLVGKRHPHHRSLRDTRQERVGLENMAVGPAKLAAARWFDLAAQDLAGEMHSVADPQNRNSQIEDLRVADGSARRIHAVRPAGKD